LIDETLTYDQGGPNEGSAGGQLQTIVWMYQYNSFGQLIETISPEGNVRKVEYYAEDNPDGDSIITPPPPDGRNLEMQATQPEGRGGGGYVKRVTDDPARSYFQQTTGTDLTATGFNNNNTNPAVTDIMMTFGYDDVGNITSITNPRGIRTDYFVNELNET